MKYIEKNSVFADLINQITFKYALLISKVDQSQKLFSSNEVSPLWITGFFRSGTSLVSEILNELGVDFGPKNHLLKAKGERANWNPNGFCENYLFMDWSLSIFENLNSWGHFPPSENDVKKYDVSSLTYKKFLKQSIIEIHDDRISNINKVSLLSKYYPNSVNDYLKKEFKGKIAVKNPHFSVLSEVLLKYWPESKFLVVYRNPDASINSSKKIADTINYELYINYYSRLLEKENIEVTYFSYDKLMSEPIESITKLQQHYNLDVNRINVASDKIKPSLYRYKQELKRDVWPSELKNLYLEMEARAINV